MLNRRKAVASLASSIALGSSVAHASTPSPVSSGKRIVTDYLGREIEVPVDPKRVITLSLPILEISLSVGKKPVGSASYGTIDGFPDYLGDQTEGIELVGANEWDFEKIIALDPDLAIMDYFGDQDAEALSLLEQIVPVVTVGEFRENWRYDSAQVAEALNRRDEFKSIEDAYDTRVSELRDELSADWAGKTVALLRFRAEDIRILKSNSFAGTVLADLDLHFPNITDSGSGIAEAFSMEQAQLVDVDGLFVVHDSGAEAEPTYVDAMENPVFQLLNVVQRGNVYLVDQEPWITLRGYGATEPIFADIEKYLVESEPGLQPVSN